MLYTKSLNLIHQIKVFQMRPFYIFYIYMYYYLIEVDIEGDKALIIRPILYERFAISDQIIPIPSSQKRTIFKVMFLRKKSKRDLLLQCTQSYIIFLIVNTNYIDVHLGHPLNSDLLIGTSYQKENVLYAMLYTKSLNLIHQIKVFQMLRFYIYMYYYLIEVYMYRGR